MSSGRPVEIPRNCATAIVPVDVPLNVTEMRVEAELIFGTYHSSADAAGFGDATATAFRYTFDVLSVTVDTVTAELAMPNPTTNPAPPSMELCGCTDQVEAAAVNTAAVEFRKVIAIYGAM